MTRYEIKVLVHDGGKTIGIADLTTESEEVAASVLRAAADAVTPRKKAAPVYRGESGEYLPKAEVPGESLVGFGPIHPNPNAARRIGR